MAYDIEQIGRSRGVEKLGADGDPPCVSAGQLMDGHGPTVGEPTDAASGPRNDVGTFGPSHCP